MSVNVVNPIAKLGNHNRSSRRQQGARVLPLAIVVALVSMPGTAAPPPQEPPPAFAGAPQRPCRDTAAAVVAQFRNVTLSRIDETPEGIVLLVEIPASVGPDALPLSLVVRDGLDRFGFKARGVIGQSRPDGDMTFQWELACPSSEPPAPRPAGPPLNLPCPTVSASAHAELLTAITARSATSPHLRASVVRNGDDLRISGSAETMQGIQTFSDELEGCPTFSEVALVSVTAAPRGYTFELEAKVAP